MVKIITINTNMQRYKVPIRASHNATPPILVLW